jgi:hypothetical protein
MVISTLNGTTVCYRHRESGTLYMSPVILGPQKTPTLTRVLVALQVAAIRDCMGRARAEGWDGSLTPKPEPPGDGPGLGLGTSRGEGQEHSSGMGGEDGAGGMGGGGSGSMRKRKRGGTDTEDRGGQSAGHASTSYDLDGISAPFPVSYHHFRHIFSAKNGYSASQRQSRGQ